MLPTVIYDHSPMFDYQKIQSTARYTLSVSLAEPMVQTDNEENLKESSFYRFSVTAVKIIFILAGVCLIVFLCMLPSIMNTDERPLPEPLRSVVTYDMIIFFVLIFGGLAWICIMAFLENHVGNKDIKAGIDVDTRTFILSDGRIAVSDEQHGIGRQCTSGVLGYIRCTNDRLRPVEDYPFTKMVIIDKVYSVSRENGTISADADMTVFFLKFPLSDDDNTSTGISDNVGFFYNYYRMRKRGKMKWYENMYGREILLQTLDAMKSHE